MNMYIIRNIRIPLAKEYDLHFAISKKINIPKSAFKIVQIQRKAHDFRKKKYPIYDFTVIIECLEAIPKHPDVVFYHPNSELLQPTSKLSDVQPIIVGMGPAGLFCAMAMVENGLKPILIDRGDDIETRAEVVKKFWQQGILDVDSNVQFGEGGAGAFSDGKLTCRSKDSTIEKIYQILIRHGAKPEIAYDALPHLGTEGIRRIMIAIREFLKSRGCEFRYRHLLQDVEVSKGRVSSVVINGQTYHPELLILALGNSARDTFRMLHSREIALEAKDFAVGFRIEHDQDFIDERMYGHKRWRDIIGPATYRLVDKRTGSYSFCMCPGGYVVASSSVVNTIVTNGMSYAARNNRYCNSAIVTNVDKQIYGNSILSGIEFQEQIEKHAYKAGYQAPIQSARSFIQARKSNDRIVSSYQPQCYNRNLVDLFPQTVSTRLKSALQNIDGSVYGFVNNGVLIAPETRTSSPIRILRNLSTRNSVSATNLFAVGEGAGYAGGIISSSADGYRIGALFYF